ncbi:hypothetical protein HYALB_00001872 [Hymenoscyphus albidus]|uniref:Uncharacterized protein n=1 Tax=Hymenoscyphus albidus TaxID=595503 RepID=A0A9N9LMF4_9HELO|nr:hypothetical protein HYALB_00001872 [Hymenoscyphus albidus]
MPETWYSRASPRRGSYAGQPSRLYGDGRSRYPHDDEDFIQDYSYARQPARSYGDSRSRYPHDESFIKDYSCRIRMIGIQPDRLIVCWILIKIMDLATAEIIGILSRTKMDDIIVTNPLYGFHANMKTGNTEMGNFNLFSAPVEIYNIAISKAGIGTLLYMALIMSIMRGWIDHLYPIRVSLVTIIVDVDIGVIIVAIVDIINGFAGRVWKFPPRLLGNGVIRQDGSVGVLTMVGTRL